MQTEMPEATRWSEEDIARAVVLRKTNMSASQIAERLGRSRNSVIGLMSRNRDLFPKGIAGVKPGGKQRKMEHREATSREWPGDQIGTAALMWAKGSTAQEIGAAIGRSAAAVYNYAAYHPRQFPPRIKLKTFEPGPLLSKKAPLPPAAPDSRPVTLFDRRANQCHFPLWDNYGAKPTADSLYCGGAVDGGSDYCAFHRTLMYRPKAVVVKPERRRAA